MKSENSPIRLSSGRIAVRFLREGDRFVHFIERDSQSTNAGFLASVPCSAQDAWPEDAPLQQVVIELVGSPERNAILGVGMSGHGHWSLAVEASEIEGIRFDWACRVTRPATRLGNQYAWVAPQAHLQPLWVAGSQPNTFTHKDATGAQWSITAEVGTCVWNPATSRLIIVPGEDLARVGTHCWRYRVNLA